MRESVREMEREGGKGIGEGMATSISTMGAIESKSLGRSK